MDVGTFERLLGERGQQLIAEITERAGIESDLALGTRLRTRHDVDLVAAAVTQAHLRGKARAKLGADATSMYFTHEALEQATRATVAAHRATRMATAGASLVDLGCGIGSDLVAAARAGLRVHGVDTDPLRVQMAAANLAALGLSGSAEMADATSLDRGPYDLAFVDPARRGTRGRTFDPRSFAPDWDFVAGLLDGRAVAKTMPGLAHELVPDGVEAEWVSDGGDLVEACLWGRPLAQVRQRATVLPSGATLTDEDDPGPDRIAAPGAYLYEPDDAVIRAGLVTAVAAITDGWLLDPKIAYVSSDRLVPTPFARAFQVVDELPFRDKPLKAALRSRGVGALTIKKRGVQVVPEHLVKRLALRGSTPATVIMTRVDGRGRAYLVEPVRVATAPPTP